MGMFDPEEKKTDHCGDRYHSCAGNGDSYCALSPAVNRIGEESR